LAETSDSARELAVIVENSMQEFRQGMDAHLQMGVRIGRRTTQIVRFGMAGLTILGAALFFLIAVLTRDFATITGEMQRMSVYMESMERNFTRVAADIGDVRQSLASINNNIADVPAISHSVESMDGSMTTLSTDMSGMLEQIRVMTGSVAAITANLQLINQQFAEMNFKVGHMAGDMNQMSKPLKLLPFH